MLGTPAPCPFRALLRLGSSRAFVYEGPDNVERRFWWRRLEGGNYDVSHQYLLISFWRLTRPLCPSLWDCYFITGGFLLAVIRRS